ncbi:MAG: hypothetical protein LQ343_002500 [Gyalolechia ehrenbergii]|nr:MAG: hypothetical protein LQ343_002500 [Gyalolechia ehrenbergii]
MARFRAKLQSASVVAAVPKKPAVSRIFSAGYIPYLILLHSDGHFADIRILSQRLCAPLGGLGPSLTATLSAILASTQLSISTTPTIPPSVTAPTAVSSVLATATLAPDLGNPAYILSYPSCAQICNNETIVIGKAIGAPYGYASDILLACGPDFRAATAGCEAATCRPLEYQNTQLLAQQLCGSYYNSNATLSSAVTAAIASATAEAEAATDGKDPTDVSVYPPCGQQCIPQNNFNGCGSNTNLLCICQGIEFNNAINRCERDNCPPQDLQTIIYLAEKLCEPVGGILTNPINYTGPTNNFTNGSSPPVPFTGAAAGLQGSFAGYAMGFLAVGLGFLML